MRTQNQQPIPGWQQTSYLPNQEMTELQAQAAFPVLDDEEPSSSQLVNELEPASLPTQAALPIPEDEEPSFLPTTKRDIHELAVAFAESEDNPFAFDMKNDTWMHWNGHYWEATPSEGVPLTEAVEKFISDLGERVSSKSKIKDVIYCARAKCVRQFVDKPNLINFSDQTLDWQTGDKWPHRRDDNLTSSLPYPYAPGPYPTIERTMRESISDALARATLMAHFGLALIGDLSFQKAVVLIGPRRSGKSTMGNVGLLVVGGELSYASATLFSYGTEGFYSRERWRDRHLVMIDETPEDAFSKHGDGLLKTMIAHGGVAMRTLYKEERLDNQWKSKLIMTTNDEPQFVDRSGALAARLIFILCDNTLPDAEQNRQLLDTLRPEIPAFAAACMEEAKRTIAANQYPISPDMQQLGDGIETRGDALKLFVSQCLIMEDDAQEANHDLYAAFIEFHGANGYEQRHLMSQTAFVKALRSRWPGLKDHTRRRPNPSGGGTEHCTLGLRLRKPDEE